MRKGEILYFLLSFPLDSTNFLEAMLFTSEYRRNNSSGSPDLMLLFILVFSTFVALDIRYLSHELFVDHFSPPFRKVRLKRCITRSNLSAGQRCMVDTVKLAGDLKQQELFEMQKPLQECLIEIGIPDKSGSFLLLPIQKSPLVYSK